MKLEDREKHAKKEIGYLYSLESILYKVSDAIHSVESEITLLNSQLKELNELEEALLKKYNKAKS